MVPFYLFFKRVLEVYAFLEIQRYGFYLKMFLINKMSTPQWSFICKIREID